jgi:CubicO group peptidase (beta-lactamase class C family)
MKKIVILIILLIIARINIFSQIIECDLTKSNLNLIKSLTHDFPNRTQLSIALINGNDVSFIGYKKDGDSLIFVNNQDSVFEIASITKIFTSAILSDLACNHLLNIDDSIGSTIPFRLKESLKNGKAIIYKTLSNHTAGLPRDPVNYIFDNYPDNPYSGFSKELLIDYLKNYLESGFIPGENYEYSNLGYAILGYLIELKMNKSYEEILQEMICKKYNLRSTSTCREKIDNHIILGQDSTGKIIPNWDFNAMNPAGGILSNTVDLSKFAIANFSNDSILLFQRQQTYDSKYNAIALGWNLFKFGDTGVPSGYFHPGGNGGYSSSLIVDTNDKLAIVVLTNVSCFHPKGENIYILGFELLRNLYLSKMDSN